MPRSSRKIKSPTALAKMWDEYKAYCDSYTKQEMVESTYTTADGTTTTKSVKEILSPLSYTKTGFLAYVGISRIRRPRNSRRVYRGPCTERQVHHG